MRAWRGRPSDNVVVGPGNTVDPEDRIDPGPSRYEQMQLRITRAGVIVRTMPDFYS